MPINRRPPLDLNGHRMKTAEFLALSDDGIDRWLVSGEVREWGSTVRDRFHASMSAEIGYRLLRGTDRASTTGTASSAVILSGNVGVIPEAGADHVLGIDLAAFSEDLYENQPSETDLMVGLPTLAIEIVGRDEPEEMVRAKVKIFRSLHFPAIWVIDPLRKSFREIDPRRGVDQTVSRGRIVIDLVPGGSLGIVVEELFREP
jgi:hypothetical protein